MATLNLRIPQADSSGCFVPTLNKTGFMTTHLDPISQEFVNYAALSSGAVLEIGTAYGIASLAALDKGAKVIANDLDIRHLKLLRSQVARKNLGRLMLLPGDFPDDFNKIPDNYVDAILLCRVLHFFDGPKIERAVEKAYRLLKPGGKIFIVVDSVYLKFLSRFVPEYEARVKKGDPWPGIIHDVHEYFNEPDLPKMIHVMDPETLTRVLENQGFIIEKMTFLDRQDFPPDRRLDGRESLAAIGRKAL